MCFYFGDLPADGVRELYLILLVVRSGCCCGAGPLLARAAISIALNRDCVYVGRPDIGMPCDFI